MNKAGGYTMLKIKNKGPIEFKEYIQDKQIYIFGAGRAMESCIDLYFNGIKINKIIDNNTNLWGNLVENGKDKVEIIGVEQFVSEIKNKDKKQCMLMITSPFYAVDIVEELDKIPELDGLECFLQVLIRNTKEEIPPFEFTKGEQKIPKKIHYIWIGGKELPDQFKRNIESWYKHNPDYEIIRWDESNYDFTKSDYVREAYECQAWGFASNYARLDIVYQQGGIYLDTDVEVIQNLDSLLHDDAFFNMGCADRLNNGCGFGARAYCPIVEDLLKEYECTHFMLDNGKLVKTPGHVFLHRVIKKYGFEIINQYQNINGVAIYPSEVMSPLTILNMKNMFSDRTLSIHKEEGSWKNDREKKGLEQLTGFILKRLADK